MRVSPGYTKAISTEGGARTVRLSMGCAGRGGFRFAEHPSSSRITFNPGFPDKAETPSGRGLTFFRV